jgi:anthranilate phosphoribosyltransferase
VAPFHLLDVREGKVDESIVDPVDLGVDGCAPSDLAGGSPAQNAASLREVFGGKPGAHRHALLIGAGLALQVAGEVDRLDDGMSIAGAAIDDGRAAGLLNAIGGTSDE